MATDIYTLGFDKLLNRGENPLSNSLPALMYDSSTILNPISESIPSEILQSGEMSGIYFNGKTSFTDSTNGFRQGIDTDGTYKWIIGTTGNSVDFNVTTANTLTISGALAASTIDIGGADATSFHVDIDGNMWLGAATFAASTAKISNAGVMTIASITATGTINATGGYIGSTTALVYEAQGINTGVTGHIRGGQTAFNTGTGYFLGYSGAAYKFSIGDGGTSQYLAWDGTTMTVNGRDFLTSTVFGDGSDGDVTISGNTSLSRDMYYNNLTVNSTRVLSSAGFRIFVKGTLTVNGAISRNGTAGSVGSNGSGANGGAAGAPGAALSAGTLCGSVIGGTSSAGGVGGSDNDGLSTTDANNGNNQTVALGSNGKNGAQGGYGGNGIGFVGGTGSASVGTGGTVTAAYSRPFSATSGIMMIETGASIAIFQTAASNGGSTGGGGGGAKVGGGGIGGGGGGGGGCGSPAGTLVIAAKTITVGAAGSITANGGAGGNGGNGANGSGNGGGGGGGGGGGSGGNGGNVVLIYQSYTNNGTVSANGGAAGTKGTGGTQSNGCTNGFDGNDGIAGANGTVTLIADS